MLIWKIKTNDNGRFSLSNGKYAIIYLTYNKTDQPDYPNFQEFFELEKIFDLIKNIS